MLAGWEILINFVARNQKENDYDWNHCKAQFRVRLQDRYALRADTLGCYPTYIVEGRRAFGGDSRNGHHRRSRLFTPGGALRPDYGLSGYYIII